MKNNSRINTIFNHTQTPEIFLSEEEKLPETISIVTVSENVVVSSEKASPATDAAISIHSIEDSLEYIIVLTFQQMKRIRISIHALLVALIIPVKTVIIAAFNFRLPTNRFFFCHLRL